MNVYFLESYQYLTTKSSASRSPSPIISTVPKKGGVKIEACLQLVDESHYRFLSLFLKMDHFIICQQYHIKSDFQNNKTQPKPQDETGFFDEIRFSFRGVFLLGGFTSKRSDLENKKRSDYIFGSTLVVEKPTE
jgi:hypothetical protein